MSGKRHTQVLHWLLRRTRYTLQAFATYSITLCQESGPHRYCTAGFFDGHATRYRYFFYHFMSAKAAHVNIAPASSTEALQGIATSSTNLCQESGPHRYCTTGFFDRHATRYCYFFNPFSCPILQVIPFTLPVPVGPTKSVESNRPSGTFFCSNADDRRREYHRST
jgi:hypothetical protein